MDKTFQDDLIHRRANYFDSMQDESIAIFCSNPESTMSNDVDYVYRQNSDFYYLSGFKEPNSLLIFEKSKTSNKYTMIVPPRDPTFETWNGRRAGVDGAKADFGADEAFTNEETQTVLNKLLPKYETVYYEQGVNHKQDKIVLAAIKSGLQNREKEGLGPHVLINPSIILHQLRVIKTPYEIELMQKTCNISVEAHRRAIQATKPGMMEYEIEAEYQYVFYKEGARRPAYPMIVGAGVNATILHYIENESKLEDGTILLADCGSEYEYYAADITRSWPVSGKFTEAQKKVYEAVLRTQTECIEMCGPNVDFSKINEFSIRSITQGLVDLGLLQGDIDELVEEQAYRRFYMHGIGHWLGIDTHDTGRVNLKKSVLKPGMIFTIEPGIYIPEDEDIPEEYRGIGVRIEDDILITEDGYHNLTGSLEKTVAELEELMK